MYINFYINFTLTTSILYSLYDNFFQTYEKADFIKKNMISQEFLKTKTTFLKL